MQQKKYINEYKEMKRRTEDMLNLPPGSHVQTHHFGGGSNHTDMMFYERQ